MEEMSLEIRTFDKKVFYEKAINAHIFTSKYWRKIGKNEYHNPGAARIVFESNDKIFNLLFSDILISTNEKQEIIIRSMDSWSKIIQEKPYYNLLDLNKARQIFSIYTTKGLDNLDPEEIFEYSWAKGIIEIAKVQKLTIPFHIGGGF